MAKVILTTMVMIQNGEGKVLVQNRGLSWKGYAFPGGHVENNESIYDCAVREVFEETGLKISNLRQCGMVHWLNTDTYERYLVFLYKTHDYTGKLLIESDEGTNSWMDISEISSVPSENGFKSYLPMFLKDKYSEAFGAWNYSSNSEIVYK